MRACDQDREAAVAVLRDAYAAGRLDLGELRDRAGAAYAARTWDDLRALTSDLPWSRSLPCWDRLGLAGPYTYGAKRLPAAGEPCVSRRPVAVTVLIALSCLVLIAAAWQPVATVSLMILLFPVLSVAGAPARARRHRDG